MHFFYKSNFSSEPMDGEFVVCVCSGPACPTASVELQNCVAAGLAGFLLKYVDRGVEFFVFNVNSPQGKYSFIVASAGVRFAHDCVAAWRGIDRKGPFCNDILAAMPFGVGTSSNRTLVPRRMSFLCSGLTLLR